MRVPDRVLLWFGLLGAPFAWAVQHVAGYGLTEAACGLAGKRTGVALDLWTIVVTALGETVAVLAAVAAVAVFRATRDVGEEPPGSRIHFLSIIGMTISPLFALIILMSGLGSVFLTNCVQG
ncbi:MAG TPA: hypothetical protein VH834_21270 [Solirubrobacteraceae bacterium]|jgi:hypothetical protein